MATATLAPPPTLTFASGAISPSPPLSGGQAGGARASGWVGQGGTPMTTATRVFSKTENLFNYCC